jgi:hypothetical protein
MPATSTIYVTAVTRSVNIENKTAQVDLLTVRKQVLASTTVPITTDKSLDVIAVDAENIALPDLLVIANDTTKGNRPFPL